MSTKDRSSSIDRSKLPLSTLNTALPQSDLTQDQPNRLSVVVAIVVFITIAIGLIWVPSVPVKVIGMLLFIWTVKTWVLETLFP